MLGGLWRAVAACADGLGAPKQEWCNPEVPKGEVEDLSSGIVEYWRTGGLEVWIGAGLDWIGFGWQLPGGIKVLLWLLARRYWWDGGC